MKVRYLLQALGIILLGGVAGCTTSQRNPSAVTIPLTSPSLLVYTPLSTNAFGNSGGSPWIIISNAFGASGSQPTAFYYGPVTTNGITVFVRPEDQIVPTNGTVQFFVGAEPVNPSDTLLYQWRKNGTNIATGTTAALTLTDCQIDDVGFYSCFVTVSNRVGSVLVGGDDDSAPGARLFVYSGTNTTIAGPYLPGSGNPACTASGAIGSLTLISPESGTKLFKKPADKTGVLLIDRTPLTPGYSAKIFVTETTFAQTKCDLSPLTVTSLSTAPTSRYIFSLYVFGGTLSLGTPLRLDMQWLR